MLTTNPFDDDKLREECGIFGVWGADNAASFVALGLHALQHRGQEAAGITSFDGANFHSHRAMGHVAGNFDRDEVMRGAGRPHRDRPRPLFDDRRDRAAQRPAALSPSSPRAASRSPTTAICRNAMKLRRTLNRRGSIFQSTSDTEVIIHLVATSQYAQHGRAADRRAAPGRGRLFAGRPDQ